MRSSSTRALRCIDIVNDVAFTFMDLHAAGQRALAWRFINAWVEHTGDFDGLTLLHGYAAYRAMVRAKVALLSGGKVAEFTAYWTLAQQLAGAPSRPRLVLTMGLSGSGKSTAAQFMAEELGAVCLRSDVERKRLHGLAPTARPAPALAMYSTQATQRTYARLDDLAGRCSTAGCRWWWMPRCCATTSATRCSWRSAWAWRFRWWNVSRPTRPCRRRIVARALRGPTPRTPRWRCWNCNSVSRKRCRMNGHPGTRLANDGSLDQLREQARRW